MNDPIDKKIEAPNIILNKDKSFGKTEEYKRSNHTDFATGKELADVNFSGVRCNSITLEQEIWILGNLAARMSAREAQDFPERWEALYRNTFGLVDVEQVTKRTN